MHQPQQQAPMKTVIIEPRATAVPAITTADGCQCDCNVPPGASNHVRSARICTIISIVVHVIVFAAFGFVVWSAYLACILAFVMGGIQMCMYQKCTYITAGSLYILGAIFDLITVIIFIAVGAALLAIPSILGLAIFVIDAVFSLMAGCNWEKNEPLGAPPAPGPTVTQQANPTFPTTNVNVNLTTESGAPPPYSGNV